MMQRADRIEYFHMVQRADRIEYFHMMQRVDWIEYFHLVRRWCLVAICGLGRIFYMMKSAEWAGYCLVGLTATWWLVQRAD